MSEIADFLLRRIAEEERAARRAATSQATKLTAPIPDESTVDTVWGHALMTPGRLIAHCAARRQIIALHEISIVDDGIPAMIDGESGSCRAGRSERAYLCQTLRLLALPYADHVEFNAAWQTSQDLRLLLLR